MTEMVWYMGLGEIVAGSCDRLILKCSPIAHSVNFFSPSFLLH